MMERLPSHEGTQYFNPELEQRQQECIGVLSDARANGVDSGYLNWATGTGKTDVAARDAKEFLDANPEARVAVFCHDTRILDQTKDVFSEYFPELSQGSVYGSSIEDQEQITFAGFQKLNTKYEGGKLYEVFAEDEFDYIIVDESHHGPADTYKKVIEHFKPKFLLGLTATPDRRDSRELSGLFGQEFDKLLLEEAIAEGYVANVDYRVFTEEIKDYTANELQTTGLTLNEIAEQMFKTRPDEEIVRMVKEQIRDHPNPRTVVFCQDIKTADHFSKLLAEDEAFGSTAVLHSRLHPLAQDMALKGFKNGDADTIVVVNQMNEGVDVPEANVAVFLRATESLTVYLQQLGRTLRGKDSALVLDFVANWERIKFIQELQNKLKQTYSGLPYPHKVEEPFSFNFSNTTIQAIEAIERAREHKERKVEPELTKQDSEDKEIERLLGVPLPNRKRLTGSHQQFLLRRLQAGDQQAEREYLIWRSRTAYSAINEIPEMNGLTLEDYFQMGLEVILEDARSVDINNGLANSHIINLQNKIKSAIRHSIKTSRLDGVHQHQTWDEEEKIEAFQVLSRQPQPEDELIEAASVGTREKSLREALGDLSYRERRVLELRYGLWGGNPTVLDETAGVFNVTKERIRQIENRALKSLAQGPSRPHLENLGEPLDAGKVITGPHPQRDWKNPVYNRNDNSMTSVLRFVTNSLWDQTRYDGVRQAEPINQSEIRRRAISSYFESSTEGIQKTDIKKLTFLVANYNHLSAVARNYGFAVLEEVIKYEDLTTSRVLQLHEEVQKKQPEPVTSTKANEKQAKIENNPSKKVSPANLVKKITRLLGHGPAILSKEESSRLQSYKDELALWLSEIENRK